MKRTNVIIAVLGVAALIAGTLYVNRPAPAAPARFGAPLAPNGSSIQASTLGKDGKGGDKEEVKEIKHDTSQPLSSITPLEAEHEAEDADMDKVFTLPGRGTTLNTNAPVQLDGAVQAAPVAPDAPAPIANFDGVTNISGVLPPDTNGDVGPNHYMQWVNLSFAIYSKTGTLLYGPAAGNTIWSGFGGVCQTRNDGDPIVLYDHLADRWMVSQFAVPGGSSGYHQCIAVSQTPDPTGAWYRYDFLYSSTNMNDYPHFGVWPDGYYMTVHEFANASTWAGQGVAVFERNQMLQGLPARMVKFNLYSTDPNMGGMLPSDLDGPAPAAGTPNYFVEPDDNAGGFPQDQIQIWAFHVDWANTANSTFTRNTTLATAAFDSNMCNGARACIPQQGTTAKLDAIADRAMYRAQYRNFGGYQTIVMNHTVDATSTDRAGIRWYELRNTGGAGWAINQQSTFSPDATQRWMGSVAMNSAGDMAIGYSASSSTMYPAIRYTGRLAADALNSMTQGEGTLMAGTGAQTHTAARWGDYSMLSVDPTDDCTFWFTSEYLAVTGSAPWRTRIGSFKLANCGAPTTGTLSGTVTDSATSAAISGATVTIVGGASTTTNASGFYQFTNVTPNTYSVTAAKTGYNTGTNSGVVVTAGTTTTSNFALVAVPPTTGTLQGTVTDSSTSAVISGATVTIVGGTSTTTNASGFYQFTNVTTGTYSVTAAKTGYNTGTNSGVVVSTGATTTSNFSLTTVSGPVSTGFLPPSANAAVTTGSGDNNGYQTSPANVYVNDSVFATDLNSGSGTSTSYTSTQKDRHLFYNYGFNIPAGATINGIEARLDARIDRANGTRNIYVQFSWDGGTSWTTALSTASLTTSEVTYTLGGATNTWGRTWNASDFSNTNFRVRVIDVANNTSRDFYLDYLAINVTYTP